MSDLLIDEEDLALLHTKDYHLVFCVGPPGCGKKPQTEAIASEFRFSKLTLSEIIQKEISSKSKLGLLAEEFLSKNEPLNAKILTAILVRGIIECPKEYILIVGFPEKLEHAQYFEQNILNINLILKFNCPEEVCYRRLKEESNLEFNKTKEEYAQIYANMQSDLKELYDFYNPYSVIREIDTNKTIPEMNTIIKQNLYPLIFCIIGKRYSGKTTLSKVINEKSKVKILDFGKFLEEPDIIKRKNENEFVVSKLILKLRSIQRYKILIEDFPQNKEQYTYFVNNCKPITKIYYLKAENSSCLERANKIPMEDPNYTNCSLLDKMLSEFDEKAPFIEFLKKNTNLEEIDVNNHINLTKERMLKQIQPYCVFFNNEMDEEAKNELFNKLKNNYKYSEIYLPEVISNAVKRKILEMPPLVPEGEISKINLTLEQKIDLIRPLLYREDCKNIILNSFPTNIDELNEFESKLFTINKYIQLTSKKKLANINNENSIAVHFFKKNALLSLNPKTASDYKIEEILDMTKDINIIYGMPQSGKTTFAKYLKEKYSFELLDFKEMIEKVKKTKVDPENPDAEPEINFQDLINFLKNYIKNGNLDKKRIILDNFFIQNSPEPFLIDTYEKAIEIIKMFGKFRNFYEIEIKEETLIKKYKAKEGITEELSEDQKTAFLETLDKPKKLVEDIRQISENVIKIKCDEPEVKSKQIFDSQFGFNFIIIKHEYDIVIEKTMQLFCARNKILYINVPYLIYSHFYENDENSKKLETVYGKKILGVECKNPYDFNEFIYYKYNPIFFEKNLINKIILEHIGKHYKTIEDSGNFVILTGYFNSDLLKEQDGPYNLPLYEMKNALELGEISAFIQISRKEIKQTEDEVPEEIVIEKPKKEVKENPEGEGEEGAGEPEEEPPEEENPDGVPKFKPENFKWTSYDGQPRNYVQVLKRLKMYPINVIKSDKCRDDLIKVIKEHLDKYAKKEENKYEGMISIINVGDNIEEETTDIVNKLCELDVINEEENNEIEKNEKEKDKENKDKDVKKSQKNEKK